MTGCRTSSGRCAGTTAAGRRRRRRASWSSTSDGYRALPASIEMYRAALALARGDLVGTVRHAREALALAPPDDDLVRAGAGALGGLAAWASGDLDGAHAAYTESVAGLGSIGFVADVLGCCITLGDICQTQGRLGDALRTYQQGPRPGGVDRARSRCAVTADMHVGMASVLLERGDLAGRRASTWPRARLWGSHRAAAEPLPVAGRRGPAPRGRGRPRRRAGPARRGGARLQRRLLPERAAGSSGAGPSADPARRAGPRPRRGPRSAGSRRRRAVLPARVRARHPRPAPARPGVRPGAPRRCSEVHGLLGRLLAAAEPAGADGHRHRGPRAAGAGPPRRRRRTGGARCAAAVR